MATLPNYKVVFVGWSRKWRGGVASIKAYRTGKVRGAIYEVTEACLRQLDKHEAGYTRLNITVFDEDSQPISAIAYIKSGRLDDAQPSKEYLAVIQQGYRDWSLF